MKRARARVPAERVRVGTSRVGGSGWGAGRLGGAGVCQRKRGYKNRRALDSCSIESEFNSA
jgi:hypothetical protein